MKKLDEQAHWRAAADRFRHNNYGGIQYEGPNCPHLMPKMNFYYIHRFSWEKYTKMVGHMPWLYQ